MTRTGFLSGVLVLGLASYAAAQSDEYELVKLVTERKIAMFDMQDAYLALLAISQDGASDLSTAADNARLISEKLDLFVSLLEPDTAVGQVSNSRAKAEIWTEPEEFAAAVDALNAAADSFADSVADGTTETFNQAFEALSAACFGCHDLKPSSAGRFRAPKGPG